MATPALPAGLRQASNTEASAQKEFDAEFKFPYSAPASGNATSGRVGLYSRDSHISQSHPSLPSFSFNPGASSLRPITPGQMSTFLPNTPIRHGHRRTASKLPTFSAEDQPDLSIGSQALVDGDSIDASSASFRRPQRGHRRSGAISNNDEKSLANFAAGLNRPASASSSASHMFPDQSQSPSNSNSEGSTGHAAAAAAAAAAAQASFSPRSRVAFTKDVALMPSGPAQDYSIDSILADQPLDDGHEFVTGPVEASGESPLTDNKNLAPHLAPLAVSAASSADVEDLVFDFASDFVIEDKDSGSSADKFRTEASGPNGPPRKNVVNPDTNFIIDLDDDSALLEPDPASAQFFPSFREDEPAGSSSKRRVQRRTNSAPALISPTFRLTSELASGSTTVMEDVIEDDEEDEEEEQPAEHAQWTGARSAEVASKAAEEGCSDSSGSTLKTNEPTLGAAEFAANHSQPASLVDTQDDVPSLVSAETSVTGSASRYDSQRQIPHTPDLLESEGSFVETAMSKKRSSVRSWKDLLDTFANHSSVSVSSSRNEGSGRRAETSKAGSEKKRNPFSRFKEKLAKRGKSSA